MSRPPRKGERRMSGKTDTIDAEHAARQVLAGKATASPKLADGIVEAIRLIKIDRDSAVKAHSQAIITLKATLVTASDDLRAELEPLSTFKLVQACAALACDGDIADPSLAMRQVLASLARRWLELHQEIKVHSRNLKRLTAQAAPELVAAFGIGPDIAAEMLVTAGDNTDRIRLDAALAKLCGACPILAGSGKTNGRHRLNRGGNRQANAALYRAIIVRMRWHPATMAYVERRKLDFYRSINSVVESFWGRMQIELLNTRKWKTRTELSTEIFDWVEVFSRQHDQKAQRPWDARSRGL